MGTFLATRNEELFKNHEGMRDRGELRYLDTMGDIATFSCNIVFFSYQWLSWTHKGPNEVQREWMNSAAQHYSEHAGNTIDRTYIWLDILSIPQSNREVQQLAARPVGIEDGPGHLVVRREVDRRRLLTTEALAD